MNKKVELLAPAGSFEILKAVINAGADAVYAAGTKFGARAYANNFTEKEMLDAINYVHLNGKKLYLTVNTLLKEPEIKTLYEYLSPFYQAGLDAVIVQDFGVMRFIKQNFPDLPIHASTQMTVTGAYGAKILSELGCHRIVTARELSLKEISHIYQSTGVELECFVHGALCYSYSGQCLMSSIIGGRSGNRGRCAQPCRLSYKVFGSKKAAESSRKQREQYPLSLKDLCTIHLIPELIQSGIHSFKIEGRMKQGEYAAGVTSIYRKYIDRYESGKDCQVTEQDYQTLLDFGNRCGFTEGYYKKHNGTEMVTFQKPSHEKQNEALHRKIRETYLETEKKEKIKGILRLFSGKPASLVLKYKDIQIETTGEVVQRAQNQPISQETVLDKMKKTGNTPFVFETLELEMEENIFLPVAALNQLRRTGIEILSEAICDRFHRIIQPQSKTILSIKCLSKVTKEQRTEGKNDGSAIRLSVLTETIEQLNVVLKQPEPTRIYLELFLLEREQLSLKLKDYVQKVHEAGKECWLALPYIFRMETAQYFEKNWSWIDQAGADGYLIRNLEELSFLREKNISRSALQGDYGLYGYSIEALRGMEDMSLPYYTLPVELNLKELRELDCTRGEILLYGYQPLMLSAQCLHKNMTGCDKNKCTHYLKDRYGKLFPVKNRCEDCYNVIYNISPLALFHQLEKIRTLHPAGFRLSFTVENRQETAKIFEYYRQALVGKIPQEAYLKDFTNGHFKRGVE